MEEIRQNGKIIPYSDDETSIRMIFKNLTGRNFQGQEYAEYIRHIAIGEMGFLPGIIEHCRNGEVIGKGKSDEVAASSDFHLSGICHVTECTAAQTPPFSV